MLRPGGSNENNISVHNIIFIQCFTYDSYLPISSDAVQFVPVYTDECEQVHASAESVPSPEQTRGVRLPSGVPPPLCGNVRVALLAV